MIEPSAYIQGDCMDYLPEFPDGFFDLAIVDPPYGINVNKMAMGTNQSRKSGGYPSVSTAEKVEATRGRWHGSGTLAGRAIAQMDMEWDKHPPGPEYFEELFRVSKQQVIWGSNYFSLPPTRGIVAWDKMQPWENFSQFELAWTSFDRPAALFRLSNTGGANAEKKIHPTQKPIALYAWILQKFAKAGDIILDTHVGSASSLIACHEAGFRYIGFEIDPYYYEASKRRLDEYRAQISLFYAGMERY